MKNIELHIFIFVALLFTIKGFGQERIYLDEKGDSISLNEYRKKRGNFSRWDSIDSKEIRYSILRPQYLFGLADYAKVKEELEKTILKKIADSSTIIIEYYFKNDLCSSKRKNKWGRYKINNRKKFLKSIKKELNDKGITFICLFEEGIVLMNNPKNKKEFFFSDKTNFFKSKLFTHNALCGSFAAIKTNGEILVRNGEYRADRFAEYLKPENWSLFFKQSQENKDVIKTRF
ncbi:hypothetical protein [Winogradskyella sp. PE311]|uniref:hypothetical protein n=1 Tax=Winogradskyella sp. PE311 TaxID=3366943 RepID=UPI00398032C9